MEMAKNISEPGVSSSPTVRKKNENLIFFQKKFPKSLSEHKKQFSQPRPNFFRSQSDQMIEFMKFFSKKIA